MAQGNQNSGKDQKTGQKKNDQQQKEQKKPLSKSK